VIDGIANKRPLTLDDPDLGIVYPFVAGLLRKNDVPDAEFAAFRQRFGERGVVEAAAIMGYYALGAFTLNAARFPPRDGRGLPKLTHNDDVPGTAR
jgi:4-carboxymuconolactone decarboxylase